MSISVTTPPELARLPQRIRDRERDPRRGEMLAAWLKRHGLRRSTRRHDACPCTLGKSTHSAPCRAVRYGRYRLTRPPVCRDTLLAASWDHAEMYRRGRHRAVWCSEPYQFSEAELLRFSGLHQLAVVLHPPEESSYFPGRTHLIAVMRSDELADYLALELNASVLAIGGVMAAA